MRRADEDGMRLAGLALVVAEMPGAGQQAAVLVARLERQAHPGFSPVSTPVHRRQLATRAAGGWRQKGRRQKQGAGKPQSTVEHCRMPGELCSKSAANL